MKIAIYARVSTSDKGQETENQLRELREYAAGMEWEIFREYVDHETGARSDRTEFQAMLKDARRRRFKLLLFWSLDRLSREGVFETLQYLNLLTSYDVAYRSFTEQFFDSCGVFKEAVIGILATIAKQERIRLSERVKAGLAVARSKGRFGGRPTSSIDLVKVHQLLAGGLSQRAVGRQLGVSEALIRRRLKMPATNRPSRCSV